MINELSALELVLVGVALLLPVFGFIMMLLYARKGISRKQQRWRKAHGLLFWTLIPAVVGVVTALALVDILPSTAAVLGILVLGGTTSASLALQRKHEEESDPF